MKSSLTVSAEPLCNADVRLFFGLDGLKTHKRKKK